MRLAILLYSLLLSLFIYGQATSPVNATEIAPVGINNYRVEMGIGIATQPYARFLNSGKGSDSINRFVPKFVAWFKFKCTQQVLSFTWANHDTSSCANFNFLLYKFEGAGDEFKSAVEKGEVRPIRMAIQTCFNSNYLLVAGGLSPLASDTIAYRDYHNPYLKSISVSAEQQFYLVVQVQMLDFSSANQILLAESQFSLCFNDNCTLRGFIFNDLKFDAGKSVLKGTNPINVLRSIFHMSVNRRFPTDQLYYEYLVYYAAFRMYKSYFSRITK
ncbi:MAG: hypothetical protein L6Q81_05810 [Bacteroidia bacterium]|nr:hypothetical protein [Bacteroidia bacterium]